MKLKFYPPIKVHSWGGFGSQLNALALAQRLRELFKFRKITLIIHEGGRHNAKFELEDLDLSEFNVELTTDTYSNNYVHHSTSKANINKVLKYSLSKLGFYNPCDSLKDIKKLKPWVLVIRGSYNLFPTETFINFINLQLKRVSTQEKFTVVIHYRLGDLLSLQEKDPIDQSRLINLLNDIEDKCEIKNIVLLSSDPDIARSLFNRNDPQLAAKISFFYARPIDVLTYGVSGEIFIGTNSKMSIWPVWLRTVETSLDNYLPSIFQNELNFLNQNSAKKFRLFFY